MNMENHIQYYHCNNFQYNYHDHIISSIILTLTPNEPIDVLLLSFIFDCWLMVVCGLSFLWFWFHFSASSCSYFSWLYLRSQGKALSTNIVTFPPRRPLVVWSGRQWVPSFPSFPFFPLKSGGKGSGRQPLSPSSPSSLANVCSMQCRGRP